MDDDQATRLLERLAADVSVPPAPVADLLRHGRAARRRRRYVLAGTAAACLLVAAGTVVTVTGGDSGGTTSSEALDDPTGDRSGELPEAGAASCVAEWEADRPIAEQLDFAFDGVVTEVGPALTNRPDAGGLDLVGVTFQVREWFAGGTGPEVTVDMQPPLQPGQGRSDDTVPAFAPGSRLLVSGQPRWGGTALEDPIAWGCGFTRYYDQGTADAWRTGG